MSLFLHYLATCKVSYSNQKRCLLSQEDQMCSIIILFSLADKSALAIWKGIECLFPKKLREGSSKWILEKESILLYTASKLCMVSPRVCQFFLFSRMIQLNLWGLWLHYLRKALWACELDMIMISSCWSSVSLQTQDVLQGTQTTLVVDHEGATPQCGWVPVISGWQPHHRGEWRHQREWWVSRSVFLVFIAVSA